MATTEDFPSEVRQAQQEVSRHKIDGDQRPKGGIIKSAISSIPPLIHPRQLEAERKLRSKFLRKISSCVQVTKRKIYPEIFFPAFIRLCEPGLSCPPHDLLTELASSSNLRKEYLLARIRFRPRLSHSPPLTESVSDNQ